MAVASQKPTYVEPGSAAVAPEVQGQQGLLANQYGYESMIRDQMLRELVRQRFGWSDTKPNDMSTVRGVLATYPNVGSYTMRQITGEHGGKRVGGSRNLQLDFEQGLLSPAPQSPPLHPYAGYLGLLAAENPYQFYQQAPRDWMRQSPNLLDQFRAGPNVR
jgi:hypothetical protein